MSGRWIAIVGALLAAAGVGLGAYGAHGLDKTLDDLGYGSQLAQRTGWFETAVRYHMYHAVGLLGVAALASRMSPSWAGAAAGAILLGVGLFCGSLYAMTFLGDAWRKLGMVTPLGGLALIVGWLVLAVAAWRS
jgi:uncharacterized membrane protein YgdD (TMEM256/DUF423 family)